MSRYTPASSIATPSVSDVTFTDDWHQVDDVRDLPLRQRAPELTDSLSVKLYPLRSDDALIVSVKPPRLPCNGLDRPNCDIVLVIDVSGSMSSAAPLPDVEDQNEKEAGGLSILDLTKHAARTILQTMKDEDRLGIVTFSDDAKVRRLSCSASCLLTSLILIYTHSGHTRIDVHDRQGKERNMD